MDVNKEMPEETVANAATQCIAIGSYPVTGKKLLQCIDRTPVYRQTRLWGREEDPRTLGPICQIVLKFEEPCRSQFVHVKVLPGSVLSIED